MDTYGNAEQYKVLNKDKDKKPSKLTQKQIFVLTKKDKKSK
jgi:hypothetical protein